MSVLCTRHQELLLTALELRGLLRPTVEPVVDPFEHATQLIVQHATHFAGRASLKMLREHHCPLCFVNARNPAQLNLDGWVNDAADELRSAEPEAPRVVLQ